MDFPKATRGQTPPPVTGSRLRVFTRFNPIGLFQSDAAVAVAFTWRQKDSNSETQRGKRRLA